MAQFVFQDMINKKGLSDRFYIDSAATSREEIGNPPHYGTVRKLQEVGVPVLPHRAVQMTLKKVGLFDMLSLVQRREEAGVSLHTVLGHIEERKRVCTGQLGGGRALWIRRPKAVHMFFYRPF